MDDPAPLYQDLSRFLAPPGFRGRRALWVLAWQLIQATLFQWSPQQAYAWRRMLLRVFGARVGRKVLVRPSVRITYPWKLELGDFCWVGDQVELYTLDRITIGAHAVISQRCYLCTGTHDHASRDFNLLIRPVVIEAEAWVATDAFVAPGVRVGRGALVAARSTVLTDVPEGTKVAGNPAVGKGPRCPVARDAHRLGSRQ